ncbi:MAG: Gfo/Idh/MocA family oxidoreductase [Bacteroidota bacterium]
METINWGIIGCGDVTELKSGPAFNKVSNSKLVAVMRRDAVKAEDYAKRHGVPKWYSDASELINDPEVNAIYIATPPGSHEQYALEAIAAGRPVYLEKPMTINYKQAVTISNIAAEKNIKLVVAHYRREQPYFKKIKALLDEKAIGEVRFARLSFFDPPLSEEALQLSKMAWRIDPAIAGGGLFHDLSPHQLDLAYYFFGEPVQVLGVSANQSKMYPANDIVSGNILFKNNILFNGTWCFNVAATESKDMFEIIGSEGKISFCVFGKQNIIVNKNGEEMIIPFDAPMHVQQPMIEAVVNYFLGTGPNPCSAKDGAIVMKMMDEMSATSN